MDTRFADLEAQMRRLRTDIEALKTAVSLLQPRKQMDWFGKACLALTIVLFVALWHGLGWI